MKTKLIMASLMFTLWGCGSEDSKPAEAPEDPQVKSGKIATKCEHCGMKIPNEHYEFHKENCTKKP